MSALINIILDVVLIGLVTAGIVQATRLIRHLSGLNEGRVEMERFVREFNNVVIRAESGIKNLRQAARDSGNDLENMVDKAVLMRDELQIIVESADRIAGRLTQEATNAIRPSAETAAQTRAETVMPFSPKKETLSASQASRAERELMQALEKLG
jgi:hypothetical protein